MKTYIKYLVFTTLIFLSAINTHARPTNHINSFETPGELLFGIDKYCIIERTNEYSSDGKFSLKLSFHTNDLDVAREIFLPVPSVDKKNDESLLFDIYNKSGKNIILFYKILFASNKITIASTKLIKYKHTTVEIPFALVRKNINSITAYQFYITNNTKNVALYLDNFRTEMSSLTPFKKIAYLDLAEELLLTGNFFFSRDVSAQIFKNTIPLPFEKIIKINLFAAKGESINYPLSFRTHKKQNRISIDISDFETITSNKLLLATSIGKIKYLDKRLSYDSKFYIADMPMYIENENYFTNLPARTTRTFWLTLKIPETSDSGTYNGNIIFETITGTITNINQIPVSLCVFPFTIKKNTLTKNVILNCDLENTKPEVDRYASGFFKESGGSNNIIKLLPQTVRGDAYDDFDDNAGDCVSIFPINKETIAYYAAIAGVNDLNYLNVLKHWLNKAAKQNSVSPKIRKSENDIKYLTGSLKTTPPLNIASKWTAMLTKEQANLIGKHHDSNAVAFVAGEQKLPNGWTANDYNRARRMLAYDIMNMMELCGAYSNDANVSTSRNEKISYIANLSIPLSRKKSGKRKKETIYSVRELLVIPKIDGKTSQNEWRNSLKVKRFSKISGNDEIKVQTEARLGRYDSNFYVQVTSYGNSKLSVTNDSVELYIKPGNENKIWNKISVRPDGVVKSVKSDGILWKHNINVQVSTTDNYWCAEFDIPLAYCLIHSSDFGLNICRKNDDNIFAWKTFNKNKLKFANIKLDNADKIVDMIITPVKKQHLKIISSDAFAFGDEDIISVEIEWEGERTALKSSKLKFKIVGNDKKNIETIVAKPMPMRQKIYLKLNDITPGIYKLYVDLIDMDGKITSSANTKIKILP